MTIEARRIQRGVGATLLALALILIAAVPQARADTIYPVNDLAFRPGESTLLEVNLDPGIYKLYCPVGDHEERGMVGTVTVEEG